MSDSKSITKVSVDYEQPTGDVFVVYFSSKSNNTHRFIEKLGLPNARIPKDIEDETILIDKDFVLICPSYAGGGNDKKGSVPKQVIKFLNVEQNRIHCKGVVASGNTNFGDSYCIAGDVISAKLKIPYLFSFELLGTRDDVINLRKILNQFWGK